MEASHLDLCCCVHTKATGPTKLSVMLLSLPSHLETIGLLSPNLVLLILSLRTHFFVLAACPYNRLLQIVLRLLQISQPHIASQLERVKPDREFGRRPLSGGSSSLQLALSMKESPGDGAVALAPVSPSMPMSARGNTQRRKVDAD